MEDFYVNLNKYVQQLVETKSQQNIKVFLNASTDKRKVKQSCIYKKYSQISS